MPDVWHMDDSEGICSRITFMIAPGHAGVAINGTADSLAIFCKAHAIPTLLCRYQAPSQIEEETTFMLQGNLQIINWQQKMEIIQVM